MVQVESPKVQMGAKEGPMVKVDVPKVQVGPENIDINSLKQPAKFHLPKPDAPLTKKQFNSLPKAVRQSLDKWSLQWSDIYSDYLLR